MPFQPGNKYGGKRDQAGRPKKQEVDIKQAAAVIATEYIAEHIRPVLETYAKLAVGWNEKRFALGGQEYEVFQYDAPTTRHFVDKILPDGDQANQGQSINVNIGLFAKSEQAGSEVWEDGLTIHLIDNNGQGHKNGSDGA